MILFYMRGLHVHRLHPNSHAHFGGYLYIWTLFRRSSGKSFSSILLTESTSLKKCSLYLLSSGVEAVLNRASRNCHTSSLTADGSHYVIEGAMTSDSQQSA